MIEIPKNKFFTEKYWHNIKTLSISEYIDFIEIMEAEFLDEKKTSNRDSRE